MKNDGTQELKSALDKCEGIEADLAREANLLRDSAAEFNALQRTIDIEDIAQIQRMAILLTISTVGTARRSYRHNENEVAQKALVAASQTFSSKVFGPRLRDLEARTLTKMKAKLAAHFPDSDSLIAAAQHSPELLALTEIAGHQVPKDCTAGGAIQQAKMQLKGWGAADAFEQQYLS